MTICLGFHQGDAHLAKRLLQWIARLGGCKGHKLILVVDAGCPWQLARQVHQEAAIAFPDSVEIIDNGAHVKGWPQGPNSLFWAAAKRCLFTGQRWLWMEPDAIPLKPGWADALEKEWGDGSKSFLGAVIDTPPGMCGMPTKYMNGVAVYPPNAFDMLKSTSYDTKAFDITAAQIMVAQGVNTPLIQCFWGELAGGPQGTPPTFVTGPTGPRNAFQLSFLRPEAVLFHRNKDQTLIKLLWERDYPGTIPGDPFLVVLPFHNGDAPAMIDNLKWMSELARSHKLPCGCVLSYERNTIAQYVLEMKRLADELFNEQFVCVYGEAPNHRWPAGANWAWRHTAAFMAGLRRPWLWMESDMIPLVPEWLDRLQSEYAHCGKPVMGAVVKAFGHVQGTAVYPHDILNRCPKLNSIPDSSAFDTWDKEQMRPITHDCIHLMAHVWGIEKGVPLEYGGVCPSFRTPHEFQTWVPKGAVTFHRCKDGSLTRFLRQKFNNENVPIHSGVVQGNRLAGGVPPVNQEILQRV